jgi:peroxiredoxin
MDAVIKIGQPAPDFELPGLHGEILRLTDLRGHRLIINFWSAECPYSERADRELRTLLAGWQGKVKLWTIASNVNETRDSLRSAAAARGQPLILVDQKNTVADLYGAVTTPHLFLVDQLGILRYQGAFDDISFRKRAASRHYLRDAVEAILSDRQPEVTLTRPYGCTIVRFKPE